MNDTAQQVINYLNQNAKDMPQMVRSPEFQRALMELAVGGATGGVKPGMEKISSIVPDTKNGIATWEALKQLRIKLATRPLIDQITDNVHSENYGYRSGLEK